jgi:hypothetical protein
MNDVSAVKELAHKEVDHAIKMVPGFSILFRNKKIDFERVGVQRESDFYMGAAWATALDFFLFDFVRKFNREPTVQDNQIILETIYIRLPEIHRAISKLGL